MKITYENVPQTEDGENFKTEARLIIQTVFKNPHTPEVFAANIERLNNDLSNQLKASGYVYNRSTLTLDPVQKEVQGYICAVKGSAQDAKTVEAWAAGGMVARFILIVQNGKIWAGASS